MVRPLIVWTVHRNAGAQDSLRYIHAVRRALVLPFAAVIVVAVASCGGHPPDVKDGTAATPNGSASGAVVKPKLPGTGSGSQVAIAAPDVGCLTATCAFHQATATYFTCLAGGAGVCFHFGAACVPPEDCMIDPTDRTYKQCAAPVEGACTQWGAACAPKSACMFSFDDGLYHHCDAVSGGRCTKYGALCAP